MKLRHDARRCREDAKSQRIRLSRGWLTPAELQAQADKDAARRLAEQKKALRGTPLDLEEF